MFEYAKELLNEKIEKDMQEYDKKQEEKEDIKNNISILSNYEDLKYELKADKLRLVFSIGGLVVSVGFLFSMATNSMTSIASVVVAFYSLLKGIEYKNQIPLTNNNLIEAYKESLELIENELKESGKYEAYKYRSDNKKISVNDFELTNDILKEVKKLLTLKKDNADNSIKELQESIDKNIDRLSMFDREDLKEYFNENFGSYLGTPKNNEELIDLRTQICNSFLDNYLNEKIDYSNVHLNNKLGENNKKLIKKM